MDNSSVIASLFLKQMEERTRDRDASLRERVGELRQQSRIAFAAILSAGVVTLGVAIVAVLLVVEGMRGAVAATLIDFVSGGGTVVFWRLRKSVTDERREVGRLQEENLRVLQAIQTTLLIGDSVERDRQISGLARMLAGLGVPLVEEENGASPA